MKLISWNVNGLCACVQKGFLKFFQKIDLKNPKANRKNAGWRIDYFCISESLKKKLTGAKIHTEVFGSDHCPVELMIEL